MGRKKKSVLNLRLWSTPTFELLEEMLIVIWFQPPFVHQITKSVSQVSKENIEVFKDLLLIHVWLCLGNMCLNPGLDYMTSMDMLPTVEKIS